MIQASQHTQALLKKEKNKQDYSRNVKKLKLKVQKIRQQILTYQEKIKKLSQASNDQIIALKISKFCRQRNLTPQMLYRFADFKCKNVVTRMEFRSTLTEVGLKLTQEELTRLEYLLDEDIKGDVSLLEYNKYLHAFGLKNEHDPNDPFVKQTLKDIDFNKLLQILNEDKNKQRKKKGDRILLTYEEFLKYSHKNFPSIKDKELAKIFKLLQINQRIDLDDFIEYVQNMKKQKKRIEDKNSPIKKKPKQKENEIRILIQEDEQNIDIMTLKGKLMAVLKEHPSKQQTFHTSQFKRVESNYKLQKGSMLGLFRQIDTQLIGSINFNDIIFFYAEQETYKPNNKFLTKYSFILMGKKLLAIGQKPQALIASFARQQKVINQEEFTKLCQLEFGLKEETATKLFELLLDYSSQKINDKCVSILLLISLMKVNVRGIKNMIKPILQQKHKNYFYKRNQQTICTNGIVAYKICESLVNQLAMSEKYQKWDDFEFGPNTEDELGLESLGRHIVNPHIRWHRAQTLHMKQFYVPVDKSQALYSLSSMCTHDLFYKSLETIVKHDERSLYRKSSQIIKHSKTVEQSQLIKLFEGLHPLAFHRFRERGIYVVQFFIRGKWVYVIIDDKIPCNEDNEPLFARPGSSFCALIPLIEKAYAKLRGSYQRIFQFPSLPKYFNQLTSKLVSITLIEDNKETGKEQLQTFLTSFCSLEVRKRQLQRREQQKQSYVEVYLGNLTLCECKARSTQKSDLFPNSITPIYFSTSIKDDRNSSKSQIVTLLTLPHSINPLSSWYGKLSLTSPKFNCFETIIRAQVGKWDSGNHTTKLLKDESLGAVVVDTDTIRETFNAVVEVTSFRFDDCGVLLRKEIEFEKNFICLYKLKSTDKLQNVRLVVVLSKIVAPDDAKILVTLKTQKQNNEAHSIQSHTVKGQFGCLALIIPSTQHDLEIKVDRFDSDHQYIYQLSFYFDHPRYSLKQRDRHLLFRYVSQYEERSKLDFDLLADNQKRYFYENFFLNANRKGVLCC